MDGWVLLLRYLKINLFYIPYVICLLCWRNTTGDPVCWVVMLVITLGGYSLYIYYFRSYFWHQHHSFVQLTWLRMSILKR